MAAAPGQHIEAPIGIVFPVEVPDFGGKFYYLPC